MVSRSLIELECGSVGVMLVGMDFVYESGWFCGTGGMDRALSGCIFFYKRFFQFGTTVCEHTCLLNKLEG